MRTAAQIEAAKRNLAIARKKRAAERRAASGMAPKMGRHQRSAAGTSYGFDTTRATAQKSAKVAQGKTMAERVRGVKPKTPPKLKRRG